VTKKPIIIHLDQTSKRLHPKPPDPIRLWVETSFLVWIVVRSIGEAGNNSIARNVRLCHSQKAVLTIRQLDPLNAADATRGFHDFLNKRNGDPHPLRRGDWVLSFIDCQVKDSDKLNLRPREKHNAHRFARRCTCEKTLRARPFDFDPNSGIGFNYDR